MKDCIVLVSENSEDQVFAAAIAKALSIPLTVLNDFARVQGISGWPDRLVFLIDISNENLLKNFERDLGVLVGSGEGQIDPLDVHLIGTEGPEQLKDLVGIDHFGNFLTRSAGAAEELGDHYGRRICASYKSRGQAGEKKDWLLSEGELTRHFSLENAKDKNKLLQQVQEFVIQEAAAIDRVAAVIVTAVDELVMNAIFDAPEDEHGKQRYAGISRNEEIQLGKENAVALRMAYDAGFLAFQVTDPCGTLHKANILKHLATADLANVFRANETEGGAGIGLATTFRSGGSLRFVVAPGKRTEVTVFFKATLGYRDFRKQFKFISIDAPT